MHPALSLRHVCPWGVRKNGPGGATGYVGGLNSLLLVVAMSFFTCFVQCAVKYWGPVVDSFFFFVGARVALEFPPFVLLVAGMYS